MPFVRRDAIFHDRECADLGNASFGIYLCHILVLKAVWKLLGLFVMPLGVSTFAAWALTLAGSYSLVSLCGRYLPDGFALLKDYILTFNIGALHSVVAK